MAYPVMGEEGSFTTVTGDTFYTALFGTNNGTGLVTVNSSTLNIQSSSKDVTALNSTNLKTLSGLRSYNASVSGFAYAIPRIGNLGLVTCLTPTFYTSNAFAWTLNLEPYAISETTSYDASTPGSGPTWRTFRPSKILRWSGTFSTRFDSSALVRTGTTGTEPIQAPSITDDTATTDLTNITLTYGDSAADESFTGEVQITGYSVPVVRGNLIEMTFGFVGSGPLTATGTNCLFTGGGISTNTVLAPVWGDGVATSLVARFYEKVAATTKYHETADMFWTRIGIAARVDEPVAFSMDFQGNGALTVN